MSSLGLKITLPEMPNKTIILSALLLMAIVLVSHFVVQASFTIAVGLSLAVVVFIISFFNIKFALYILIFSMLLSPEIGMRDTGGGGATIRVDDFLILIISIAWLVKMAVVKEFGVFVRTKLTLPIFLYFTACIVSTAIGIVAGRVAASTGILFVVKYFEYFLIYFIVTNHLRGRKEAEIFLVMFLITCTLVCFFSLSQVPADGRVTAPFEGASGEPNTLGGYIVLIFSVMMGIFLTAPFSRTMRIVYGSIFVLMVMVLLATQSRGSWMAFATMYMGFIVFHERKLVLGLVLLGSLLFGPIVLPNSVKDRFRYTFKKESGWASRYQERVVGVTLDTSASARIRDWKDAWREFKSKPVFGYGITGWKFIDSQYIRTLVETGIVGLGAFIFLIGTLLRQTYNRLKSARDELFRGVYLGFLVGTIALLIHGLSANSFIILRIMEPFWFLAGIVMISTKFLEEETEEAYG